MIKFLIILFLGLYIFYKFSGYLLKLFLWSNKNRTTRNFSNPQGKPHKKPKDGNVDIDYIPPNQTNKKSDKGGGDYVDYEDVK